MRAGLYIIPLVAGGKEPDVSAGGSWKDPLYRLSLDQAAERLGRGANIGLVAQKGGLMFLDIDSPDKFSCPKDTLTVLSRNGRPHYYYLNGGDVENADIPETVEVRADWRYVVGPGSYVAPDRPEGQGLYKLHAEKPPATLHAQDLPKALREKMIKPPQPPQPVTGDNSWRNKFGWTLEAVRYWDPELDQVLRGDDSKYEGDTSRGDMATLSRLLYWCYDQGEAAAILRQFRPRDKLDRDDYIPRTLAKIKVTHTVERNVNPRTWSPDDKTQKNPLDAEAVEYGDPVRLYKEIRKFLMVNIDLVDDAEYDVLTAKVLESWLIGKFNEVGYLFFVGPPRSGKTRAMETVIMVCKNGILAATMTPAAMYRLLQKEEITLGLDEIQQYLQDDRTTFIALLNAGQRRGMKAWLCVPPDYDVEGFEVFGSKIMASTEETVQALATRCVTIPMVKNARKVPLRINREWAGRLKDKLQKLSYDMRDAQLPDMEAVFFERKFRDYRNIEAFINLVAVAPPQFRGVILDYAKRRDDQIADEEGTGFYSDLYKAIEEAYGESDKGKISIQAITDAFNRGRDEREQLDPRSIGRDVNVMGLREVDRMGDGKMARKVNERVLRRLRRRYGDPQARLDEPEVSEESEVSEVVEEGGKKTSDPANVDRVEPEVPLSPPSVTSETSETSETSDRTVIDLPRETQQAIVDAAAEFLKRMPGQRAEHIHLDAHLDRRFNVGPVALHAVLWEHPDFVRRDGHTLTYSPKEGAVEPGGGEEAQP